MGHQKYAEAKGVPERNNQSVKSGGANGIEPGGGLVQEQHLRVQRQGPCERGSFNHAT